MERIVRLLSPDHNQEAKMAQKRAHQAALRLTESLLEYPQEEALQKTPEILLPDGRKMHVILVNSGKLRSLKDIQRFKRPTDHIKVSIFSTDMNDQKGGYFASWNLAASTGILDYNVYDKGMTRVFRVLKCPTSEVRYALNYKTDGTSRETSFDSILQRTAYERCEQIFTVAKMMIVARQSLSELEIP